MTRLLSILAIAFACALGGTAQAAVIFDESGALFVDPVSGMLDQTGAPIGFFDLPGSGRYRVTVELTGAEDSYFELDVAWRDHLDVYAAPWDGVHAGWIYFFDQDRDWITQNAFGPGSYSFVFDLPQGYIFTTPETVTVQDYSDARIHFTSLSNTDTPYTWHYTVSTIAVPEPTQWILLIMGFGGIGAMLRRRRRYGIPRRLGCVI